MSILFKNGRKDCRTEYTSSGSKSDVEITLFHKDYEPEK